MSMQLTIFEHSKIEKRCAQCKEVKLIVNFAKNKAKKDGFNFHCSQCRKVYYENNKKVIAQNSKVYYQNNKEAQQFKMKVNYQNNKEMRKQQSRDYYQNNKEVVNYKGKLYIKKRFQSDPLFRVIHNLRGRVSKFCKSVGMQKNWKSSEVFGCTREEFKEYFESLFTEGMTWENYGAWHVDHIKPISLATTEQEAIQLSHYTNLQPLWAEDNLRKSNNY